MDSDPVHAEHLGVDAGQDLLGLGLAGARYRSPLWGSGAGRARVSSLPLTVSGSVSRTTTADGTMYGGSRSASRARTSAGSADPVI